MERANTDVATTQAPASQDRIATYAEFWPFYLHEHTNATNRRLHFAGTTLVIALAMAAVALGRPLYFALMPLAGYGFAWAGHFLVERNRPATFKYPLWSLISDFRMWWRMLMGQGWSGELKP